MSTEVQHNVPKIETLDRNKRQRVSRDGGGTGASFEVGQARLGVGGADDSCAQGWIITGTATSWYLP